MLFHHCEERTKKKKQRIHVKSIWWLNDSSFIRRFFSSSFALLLLFGPFGLRIVSKLFIFRLLLWYYYIFCCCYCLCVFSCISNTVCLAKKDYWLWFNWLLMLLMLLMVCVCICVVHQSRTLLPILLVLRKLIQWFNLLLCQQYKMSYCRT